MVDLTDVPAPPSPGSGHPTVTAVAERVAEVVVAIVPCSAAGVLVHGTDVDPPVVAATSPSLRSALEARAAHVGSSPTEVAVLLVPLRASDRDLGVLEVHLGAGTGPDDEIVARAFELASLASVALEAARDRDELRRAVETRGVIGIAMGILVERYGLAVDAAFQVLVRHSQHRNVKLRDVARTLVEQGRLPDDPTDDTADE